MGQLSLLTVLLLTPLLAHAGVSTNRDNLRALGFGDLVTDDEVYDPWLGFKLNTRLDPDIRDEKEAQALARAMLWDADPCARQAARLIGRDGTKIVFVQLQDPPTRGHAAEGGYKDNTIAINSNHRYMLNSRNMKKRIVHEAFHRVQDVLDMVHKESDFHVYAHRPIILAYLEKHFSDGTRCVLPEVPELLRNSVEDTVTPTYPSPYNTQEPRPDTRAIPGPTREQIDWMLKNLPTDLQAPESKRK